jgi:hypothetical protein
MMKSTSVQQADGLSIILKAIESLNKIRESPFYLCHPCSIRLYALRFMHYALRFTLYVLRFTLF